MAAGLFFIALEVVRQPSAAFDSLCADCTTLLKILSEGTRFS